MKSIFLIGLPGSGKSSLGQKAAEALELPFIDLDMEIEKTEGLSIKRIFDEHGEDYFRRKESEQLEAAFLKKGSIVATGGGIVSRPENLKFLKDKSFVIFIDRPLEAICKSLAADNSRPLLSDGELENLLKRLSEQRRPLYLEQAGACLFNDGDEDAALEKLLAILRAEGFAPNPQQGAVPSRDILESLASKQGGEFSASLPHFALIGYPIGHSLSPQIHGAVFEALGLKYEYQALEVPPDSLAAFSAKVRGSRIKGFNVTIPHKQSIMPFLDEIDQEAKLCGAVNTVVNSGGRLIGYNTDMGGFSTALKDFGRSFKGEKLLILGAGGAAAGLLFKAALEGALGISILARTVTKANLLLENIRGKFSCQIESKVMDELNLNEEASKASLLINCTPLGMQGVNSDFNNFDFLNKLPPQSLVCDLIYKPAKTKLLAEAEKRGLMIMNGLPMLIYQALLADEIFLENISDKQLKKQKLYKAVLKAMPKNLGD